MPASLPSLVLTLDYLRVVVTTAVSLVTPYLFTNRPSFYFHPNFLNFSAATAPMALIHSCPSRWSLSQSAFWYSLFLITLVERHSHKRQIAADHDPHPTPLPLPFLFPS
jgi:hypothetical protein